MRKLGLQHPVPSVSSFALFFCQWNKWARRSYPKVDLRLEIAKHSGIALRQGMVSFNYGPGAASSPSCGQYHPSLLGFVYLGV